MPPSLTSSSPAQGDTVRANMVVRATFDEPLDPATITASSFFLVAADGGQVPATVSWDSATSSAELIATGGLPRLQTVQANLTTDLRDLAGNALASPHTWTFSTFGDPNDVTPPTIVSMEPNDGASQVPYDATVRVVFSEPMLLDAGAVTLAPATAGTGVSLSGDTLTIAHAAFDAGVTYTVSVGASSDLAGNALAPFTWSFTTIPDTVAPTVVGVTPRTGSRFMSRNQEVTVSFSEDMNPATLTPSTLTLTGVSTIVSYDPVAHVATISPATPLAPASTITLNVTGAQDLAGNTLAPFSSDFRTVGVPTQVLATTPATHRLPSVATNVAGDVMAVWSVDLTPGTATIDGTRWSRYDAATGLWSSDALLSSVAGQAFVTSDGTGFAALTLGSTSASLSVFTAGAWNTITPTSSGGLRGTVVSDGAGRYAAGWESSLFYVTVYSAGTWSTTQVPLSGVSDCQLAGGGGSFMLACRETNGTVTTSRNVTGNWEPAVIAYSAGEGQIVSLQLQRAPSGFGLAFQHHSTLGGATPETLRVMSSSTNAWNAPVLLGTRSGGTFQYALTQRGNDLSVLYFDYVSPNLVPRVRFSSGTTWSSATAIAPAVAATSVDSLSFIGNATTVAAQWTIAPNVQANVFASGAWGTATTLSTSAASIGLSLPSGGTVGATYRTTAGDVATRVYSGSWGPETVHQSAASGQTRVLGAGADRHEVIWQTNGNLRHRRFASGTWGALRDVHGVLPAAVSRPVLARNGSLVVAAWREGLNVFSRTWRNGAWGMPGVIESGSTELSLIPWGNTFMAATQAGTSGINVRVQPAGMDSFGTPVATVATGTSLSAITLAVSASPTEAMLVWRDAQGLRSAWTTSGTTWTTNVTALSTTGTGPSLSTVTNSKPLLAFCEGAAPTALLYAGSGVWTSSAVFVPGPTSCSRTLAATSGATHAAMAAAGFSTSANVRTTSWGTAVTLSDPAKFLGSSSFGFVAFLGDSTARYSVFGSSWSPSANLSSPGASWIAGATVPAHAAALTGTLVGGRRVPIGHTVFSSGVQAGTPLDESGGDVLGGYMVGTTDFDVAFVRRSGTVDTDELVLMLGL